MGEDRDNLGGRALRSQQREAPPAVVSQPDRNPAVGGRRGRPADDRLNRDRAAGATRPGHVHTMRVRLHGSEMTDLDQITDVKPCDVRSLHVLQRNPGDRERRRKARSIGRGVEFDVCAGLDGVFDVTADEVVARPQTDGQAERPRRGANVAGHDPVVDDQRPSRDEINRTLRVGRDEFRPAERHRDPEHPEKDFETDPRRSLAEMEMGLDFGCW